MAVEYKKNKNTLLFSDFEKVLNVHDGQNYIPIYERFFELNTTNWGNVTLSHLLTLSSVVEKNVENENTFTAIVRDQQENEQRVNVFFKYSPLLDPNKYITGAYQIGTDDLLPSFNVQTHEKICDTNNAAYIDSFFYYLSSRLKHKGFVHGLDFYGSYLGYKGDFKYMLEDDAEFIMNDGFFKKHHGDLFQASVELPGKQDKLNIGEECTIEFDSLDDDVPASKEKAVETEIVECNISEEKMSLKSKSSSISSNSSNSESDNGEEESLGSNVSSDVPYEPNDAHVTIKKYPVQIIAIESCKQTLDSLLDTIQPNELTSCLFQVIMTLIAYQKVYQFTHNDLHTNNIMYITTEEEYLYYFVDDTAYQVPTFGKIFKIIDFGRSVYTFQDKKFVSDSFSDRGDAATQYNTEPYYDETKPRLEPNYSFDLCRLACSMVDMLPETDEYEALNDLIEDWCMDDKGRNVVYKKNGDERYPGFKLYKMIARTVNKHVPSVQLRRPIFQQYIIKKKKLKGHPYLDINTL